MRDWHVVALMGNGTVWAAREPAFWKGCEAWRGIVAVGSYHTVGLTAWGTVVAVERLDFGQCGMSVWEDIVAIAAGGVRTVGLRSDGSVSGVGSNDCGQLDAVGRRLI